MASSIAQRARAAAQTSGKVVSFADVQRQLVNGGYLRASLVLALTEFDIIAGGLAWGIRNSRYTIDCNFVENASIRDKLRVSENICAALKDTMKCPHQLLPHQIQGLDYPCIAIIVQWLLQRVAMAREDNAVAVAKYTSFDFARKFHMPLPPAACSNSAAGDAGLGHFAQTHQFWRNSLSRPELARFRRPQRTMISDDSKKSFSSPLEHANAILLEYGDQYLLSSHQQQQQQQQQQEKQASGGAGIELDAAEKLELKQQREEEEREKLMLEKLLSSMSQHTEKSKISSNELGAVLAAVNTKRLTKLQRQFDERMALLQAQLEEENQERSRVEAKRQELAERKEEHAAMEAKAQRTVDKLTRAKEMVCNASADRGKKAEDLARSRADCDEAEAALRQDGELSALLDRALDTLARIKKAEQKMESATEEGAKRVTEAKEELNSATSELDAVAAENGGAEQEAAGGGGGGEEQEENPTTRALAKSRQKLEALEAELSRLDMDIMRKQRDIDSTLTRAEYAQYEQRLIELDEECACKYDETQLLIQEQNLMVEISRAITNEDDVMTNIFDGVKSHLTVTTGPNASGPNSSKVKASRESLQAVVVQVQDFLKDISALRSAQEARLKQENSALADKRAKYDAALSKQRAFRATVDEVARLNEKLSAMRRQLRELRSALHGSRDEDAI